MLTMLWQVLNHVLLLNRCYCEHVHDACSLHDQTKVHIYPHDSVCIHFTMQNFR